MNRRSWFPARAGMNRSYWSPKTIIKLCPVWRPQTGHILHLLDCSESNVLVAEDGRTGQPRLDIAMAHEPAGGIALGIGAGVPAPPADRFS